VGSPGAIIEASLLRDDTAAPKSGFILELISAPWPSVVPRSVIIAMRAEIGAGNML
jgi:hypothetical protein